MKISIINDDASGCAGAKIWVNEKTISNVNQIGFRPKEFSDDEIFHIIGQKNFDKYENGTFILDVPKWKVQIVSGEGLRNATSEQNKYSFEYQKIKS